MSEHGAFRHHSPAGEWCLACFEMEMMQHKAWCYEHGVAFGMPFRSEAIARGREYDHEQALILNESRKRER